MDSKVSPMEGRRSVSLKKFKGEMIAALTKTVVLN